MAVAKLAYGGTASSHPKPSKKPRKRFRRNHGTAKRATPLESASSNSDSDSHDFHSIPTGKELAERELRMESGNSGMSTSQGFEQSSRASSFAGSRSHSEDRNSAHMELSEDGAFAESDEKRNSTHRRSRSKTRLRDSEKQSRGRWRTRARNRRRKVAKKRKNQRMDAESSHNAVSAVSSKNPKSSSKRPWQVLTRQSITNLDKDPRPAVRLEFRMAPDFEANKNLRSSTTI